MAYRKILKDLGFSVEYNDDCIKFHNAPMVERLSEYFKMEDCKPSSTTLPSGLDLTKDDSEVLTEERRIES